MGNRKITKKTIKGKEGLHPGSRKAGQLNRVVLRSNKLQVQKKNQNKATSSKLHRPLFFLHSLPSAHPLSLPSLRALISEVYLTRHDPRIEELTSARRAGRPKDKELLELEEIRRIEWAEWETGIEVPDLTHPPTARLLYQLQQSDLNFQPSHVDLLRQIRLIKDDETRVIVSREGKTGNMGLTGELIGGGEAEDWTALVDGEAQVEAMQV